MNKITALLILSFLLLTAFKAPKKIIGKWKVNKVVRDNGKVIDDPEKWIEFQPDGIMTGGALGSPANNPGTWSYSRKPKSVTMTSDGEANKDDGEYLIQKLTRTELVLERNGLLVYLEKMMP